MAEQPTITDGHYVGFGQVITRFAALEVLLEEALASMLKIPNETAPLILSALRYDQKRDLLKTLAGISTWPAPIRSEFVGLLDDFDNANKLRVYVAHAGWTKGRKPGCIKPLHLRARGRLVLLGLHHNEREYSAEDLQQEAKSMIDVGDRFRSFLDRHGLRVTFDEE